MLQPFRQGALELTCNRGAQKQYCANIFTKTKGPAP